MAPSAADVAITVTIRTLVLPEPPSLNNMLDMAKKRTNRLPNGGWSRRAIPVVYDAEKQAYETKCLAALRGAGISIPRTPWPRWSLIAAEFRLFHLRDEIELLASLKWPVDALVNLGFVADDSPRELVSIPRPVQVVDQKNRRVTLTIMQEPP
jgi:hypothetical protein